MQIQTPMLSKSHSLSLNRPTLLSPSPNPSIPLHCNRNSAFALNFPISHHRIKFTSAMTSNSSLSNRIETAVSLDFEDSELDGFAAVGNKVADAAGEVIRKYFRKSFDILDKEDSSKFFKMEFLFLFLNYLIWGYLLTFCGCD